VIAPRASLIEFPGSRNRVTYGGYGQFSCVREREHPCVLRISAPGSSTHGGCSQLQLLHSPLGQDISLSLPVIRV